MKKIIFIDDKTKRQDIFTMDTSIDLNSYGIVDNYTGKKFDELWYQFENNNFDILKEYEVIITHRSAYEKLDAKVKVIDRLKEICKKYNKKLVFFSGGISSIKYSKEPFEFLLLNSKVLYSENLKLFCKYSELHEPNILQLAYGEKWTLSLLLNTLEKTNLFIGKNTNNELVSYVMFKKETALDTIKNFISFDEPELKNGGAKMSDIKKLSDNITKQIKQQVVLNV